MLGIKPYKTESVGKRFAQREGPSRDTVGSRSTGDRQGKVGSYTTDRGFYSVAGSNKADGKYLGARSARSSGTPGGVKNRTSVNSNQPTGSYRGNKSASVGAVNMRGEARNPGRGGAGSVRHESGMHSTPYGYDVGDLARGYKSLGSGRDAMNSSQGGARGK